MPNVSHHVEVEVEEHQSLEDPLMEMVKAPSHKKRVFFGELVPNTLARKGISNVAPSRLAVAVADGQQLAMEIRSLEQDKHTQMVEWQVGKHVITQMLLEYDTQILTQID